MIPLRHKTKYFLLFILIGIAVYFPIFSNGYILDDLRYIINNPEIHQINLPVLLGPNKFNSSLYYRPVEAVYFAFLYSLFRDQAFFYHFLQLTLHITASLLIFLLSSRFFTKRIACFLALIFLVHPINVESVAWISATNNQLSLSFGIAAFLLAMDRRLDPPTLSFTVVLLLLGALSRDVGVLFVPLIITYRYFFKKGNLKPLLLSGIGVGVASVLMRLFIGKPTAVLYEEIPIAALPFWERMLNAPAIFTFYLTTFFYPQRLVFQQDWVVNKLTLQSFQLPLLFNVAFFVFLCLVLSMLYKHDTRAAGTDTPPAHAQSHKLTKRRRLLLEDGWFWPFAFFSLWFIIGIAPLLQIVPLTMTVAERYFYFPIVGILGMIGVGIEALCTSFPRYRKVYYACALILLSLYSMRTLIRTFDWKDLRTLYGHDVKEHPDNHKLNSGYANQLVKAGEIDEALPFAKKAVSLHPTIDNLNKLGYIYQRKQQYKAAYDAYAQALALAVADPPHGEFYKEAERLVYENIAILLLLQQNYDELGRFIRTHALKRYPNDAKFYLFLVYTEYGMQHKEAALQAAARANQLSPGKVSGVTMYNIHHSLPIKLNLQPAPSQFE
jgi:tetratricopeptide (TPR) repeat protein